MQPTITTFKLLAAAVALFAVACTNTNEPPTITGSYTATTFTKTPTGGSAINVLAQGGSISLTIAENKATTGSVFEPASANGGTALQASLAGTAIQAGTKVNFSQTADTFVRDLNWIVVGNTLQVTNQAGLDATYTIVLTRQ